jgi:hypothetical protein
MRLVKLFLVVMLASAFQWGWAQSQQDDPGISPERDPIKSVHIFPNPATEFLHVKVDEFTADKVKLTLHSIIGNQMEIESEVVSEHELRVRVKDLASGYYLLAVKDGESKFRGTYKFLKR